MPREWKELERRYLSGADAYQQSGFWGGPVRWEKARRPIAEAIDHSGAFLDIGCANGLLMQSLCDWAIRRGVLIDPFGLEVSEALCDLARRRLPQWKNRIFHGDASVWNPPRRFEFVRTELGYVDDADQAAYVARLIAQYLSKAGRLIVCSYDDVHNPGGHALPIEAKLRAWGLHPSSERVIYDDPSGIIMLRMAWVDQVPGE